MEEGIMFYSHYTHTCTKTFVFAAKHTSEGKNTPEYTVTRKASTAQGNCYWEKRKVTSDIKKTHTNVVIKTKLLKQYI